MKLNDGLKALGAEYAVKYADLAAKIAGHAAQAADKAGKAKEAKATVWGDFKTALTLASEAGHTVTALRVGLEIACIEADIAPGTFRSYVATVADLYADVIDEEKEFTLEQATAISIADARKRYKTETPMQMMHAKLKEAIKDWDETQMALLLSLVADINGETAEATDEAADEGEAEQDEVRTGTDG